jgi:hypothetical protein
MAHRHAGGRTNSDVPPTSPREPLRRWGVGDGSPPRRRGISLLAVSRPALRYSQPYAGHSGYGPTQCLASAKAQMTSPCLGPLPNPVEFDGVEFVAVPPFTDSGDQPRAIRESPLRTTAACCCPPAPPTRRYQPTRHLAEGKQAGAQILTYRLPSPRETLGAGVWGTAVHHEGAGFRRDAPDGPSAAGGKGQKQSHATNSPHLLASI